MAEMPKDVQVTITPVVDTDAMAKLTAQIQAIGAGFSETAKQMKPAFDSISEALAKTWSEMMPSMAAKKITAEQIAHAYGVPVEMLGLLPPDAGETIVQAAMDGTLTGEAFVYADGGVLKNWPSYLKDTSIHAGDWDGEVLKSGECPSNGSPYVPGHLGINSMLVNSHAPSPHTWEGKTPVQIMADIQKVMDAYKGKPMPHKKFPAKDPDPNSPTAGIAAHEVFTSPLIHDQETALATAKAMLKTTGDVKVAQLDEQGNPTGKYVTLGQIGDFSFTPELAEDQPLTYSVKLPEPQTISLNYPVPKAQSSFLQALTEAKLAQSVQAEHAMLGAHLGVDLSKSSGNTVTMESNPADPNVVQVSVYGPGDKPVMQTTIPMDTIAAMADAAEKMVTIDPVHWDHDYTAPIGTAENVQINENDYGVSIKSKLSDHAWGTAVDVNLAASGGDFMHLDLGHEEAFAEAVDQGGKVKKLHEKIPSFTVKKGGVQFPKVSQTHLLANGGTLVEYPDGIATLDLPGMVTVPGVGVHKLHGKFTLATPLARKIAGLDPDPNPQISITSTVQYVAGQPCVWHHQHGWQLVTWQPTPPVSTGPDTWYDEEDEPLNGEDEQLFDPEPMPLIHPAAHLWCTACNVHWMNHKGDPVACDSGGYLRPSTPLEDKQYVDRIRMLKETGLL